MLDFLYFEIRKYTIILISSDNTFFWKEWYQDHMIWFGSIDSTTISWNTVIYNFFLNLRELFMVGIAVHKFSLCFVRTDQWASGQQYTEVRKAIIPAWNVTRMKRKLTMTVFWEITIDSKLLNQFQWTWYHSLQKTLFYLTKLKYAIFSNIKVTKI